MVGSGERKGKGKPQWERCTRCWDHSDFPKSWRLSPSAEGEVSCAETHALEKEALDAGQAVHFT